jgi:uncharacterized protein (DUF2252 family)
MLPDPKPAYRVARRVAGVGSLGHARYVAICDWKDGQLALEAKEASPSACVWAHTSRSKTIYYQKVLDSAIRCKDPFVCLIGRWLIRQLSPDSAPVEIESMHRLRDQDRLLHAMAIEAANVHLGTTGSAKRIQHDLKTWPAKRLQSGVKQMTRKILKDWKEWKKFYAR